MNAIGRRVFLKRASQTATGLAAAYTTGIAGTGETAEIRRPNIVFILCDDLGWADLPVHGNRPVKAHGGWIVGGDLKMPSVDRMAREGALCTQYYVNAAVCSPSRTGIMTGRFPSSLGIHDYLGGTNLNKDRGMPDYLDPKTPILASILKQSGYATAHFGKWHLSGNGATAPAPSAYGIDTYEACLNGPLKRPGSSAMIADKTIAFIRDHKHQQFFINVWFYDPHSPLHPTDEQLAPYKDLTTGWDGHLGALQIWYAVLTELDRQTGRILDALDELNLNENTIVVFTSDNGPESGLIPFVSHYGGASSTDTGPFRGIKRSLYEGGIREPFIVRWPGTTPAGVVDTTSVISGVDILPTVLSLTGVQSPGGILSDGEDISPFFRGETIRRKKPLMWENRFPVYGHILHRSPILAMREGKWKLLMNPDWSRVELYDIPNDPSELNNCATQFSEVVRSMAGKLLAWQKTLPTGPVHPDAGSNAYPWPEATQK